MTEPPSYGGDSPPHTNGKPDPPPLDSTHFNQTESQPFEGGGEDHGLDSDAEGELSTMTSATFSKAISGQASHYMLTFENGLQDDSDSEVEELTKSLPGLSDRNNNGNNSQVGNVKPNGSAAAVVAGRGGGHHHGSSPGGQFRPPPPPRPHLASVVKESDSELSDEGILDRPEQGDLQIPLGDSDSDDDDGNSPHSDPAGGFLHIGDDGNSSVRPDTPTPRGGYSRTRIAVDSALDSGSESSGFVRRPKPLSGSTTAVFGSVESLTHQGGEVQYRNKRFSTSDVNLAATAGPVEGLFGNVSRRRAFHGSMQRLSVGSALPMSASHSAGAYMSDDESGGNPGAPSLRSAPGRRGLNRRWSLANADTNALDEVR